METGLKTAFEQINELTEVRNRLMEILSANLLAKSQKELDKSIADGRAIMYELTLNQIWFDKKNDSNPF